MKTSQDPRHLNRIKLFKTLFSQTFNRQKPSTRVKNITQHLPAIDKLIITAAPEWPIAKLNKIDLAVLRLALYELTIVKKQPPKVIIDEAIELAKTFGTEKTPKFVNGVLGAIIKK